MLTVLWTALVIMILSSQRPIKAKESDSNHEIFHSFLTPLIGEKENISARIYSGGEPYKPCDERVTNFGMPS